jgi:hypothetical protein
VRAYLCKRLNEPDAEMNTFSVCLVCVLCFSVVSGT